MPTKEILPTPFSSNQEQEGFKRFSPSDSTAPQDGNSLSFFPPSIVQPEESNYVSTVPEITSEGPVNTKGIKTARAIENKQRKLARLNAAGLSADDLGERGVNNDVTRYGSEESMHNKVYNEYLPEELEAIRNEVNDRYGIFNINGQWMQKDGQGGYKPFEGDTREYATLYKYRTKDDKGYKIGMWGGLNSFDRYSDQTLHNYAKRFDPSFEGLPEGTTWDDTIGIDRYNVEWEMRLPAQLVVLMEGLEHGNKHNVQNRIARQALAPEGASPEVIAQIKADYEAQRLPLGSGASEYYWNRELNPGLVQDKNALWKKFNDKYHLDRRNQITDEEHLAQTRAMMAELGLLQSNESKERAVNIVKGIVPGVVNPLIVEPGAWAVETLGIYDAVNAAYRHITGNTDDLVSIGTEESRRKFLNDLFGYDTKYSEEGMAVVRHHVGNMVSDAFSGNMPTSEDFLRAVEGAISTPEAFFESLEYVAALAVGPGKATKLGKAINGVEETLKAGKLTKEAAKQEVKQLKNAASLSERIAYFNANNIGYYAVATGEAHNALEAFKENNNGEASWSDVARVTAITFAGVGLDKFVDLAILKDSSAIAKGIKDLFGGTSGKAGTKAAADSLRAAAESATKTEYMALLKNFGLDAVKLAGKVSVAAVEEGVQEYVQTIAEIFSEKWMSDKYGKDAVADGIALFKSIETQTDAFTGAMMGLVQGAEMRGLGAAGGGLRGTTTKVAEKTKEFVEKRTEAVANKETPATTNIVSDKERLQKAYSRLKELDAAAATTAGNHTPESLAEALELLDEVKETSYTFEHVKDKKSVAAAKEGLEKFAANIKESIRRSGGDIEMVPSIAPKAAAADMVSDTEAAAEEAPKSDIQSAGELKAASRRIAEKYDDAEAFNAFGVFDFGLDTTNNTETTDTTLTALDITSEAELAGFMEFVSQHDTKASVKLNWGVDNIGAVSISSQTAAEAQAMVEQWKTRPKQEEVAETTTEAAEDAISETSDEEFSTADKEVVLDQVVSLFAEEGPIDAETKTILNSFARKNNIDVTVLEQMIKNYETVEEEATTGARGVLTRERLLKRLIKGKNADPKRVKKLYADSVSFATATMSAISELEAGVAEAIDVASSLNRGLYVKEAVKKTSFNIKTKYRKAADSKSGGGFFDITVSKVGDKWVANVTEAEKLIATKKGTLDSHNRLLKLFHDKAGDIVGRENLITTDGYSVPDPSGNTAGAKKEQARLNNVKQALKDAGKSDNINKIILGQVRSGFWKPSTMRARLYSFMTNTFSNRNEAYKDTDVVFLHNIGYFQNKKKERVSDLHSKKGSHVADIEAAISAGATIVVDDYIGHKDKNAKFAGEVTAKYLSSKGYMRLASHASPSEKQIWVKRTPEAEAYSKKRNEEHAAIKKERAEELSAKNKLVLQRQRIRVAKLELANIDPDTEAHAELLANIAKMEETYEQIKTDEVVKYFTKESIEAEAKMAEAETVVSEEETEGSEEQFVETVETGLTEEEIDTLPAAEADVVTDETADATKANLDVKRTPEENVDIYVENTINRLIRDEVRKMRAMPADSVVVDSGLPKITQELIWDAYESGTVATERAQEMLSVWASLGKLRLPKKQFRQRLMDGIKSALGLSPDQSDPITVGGIAQKILDGSVGAQVKGRKYYIVMRQKFENGVPKDVEPAIRFDDVSNMQVGKPYVHKSDEVIFNADGTVVENEKAKKKREPSVVHSITEVRLDATSLLSVKNATPLGSIPVSELGHTFIDIADRTAASFKRVVRGLTKEEQSGFIFDDKGKPISAAYNLADSPARSLVFQADGSINENVAAAIGIAIRNTLSGEYRRLLLGHKDRDTVARMFNIRENEVTKEHMDFAAQHGTYMKSMADTLGKDILSSLGLGRSGVSDANRGEYDRLVVSLGNMAIAVAEEQGLLEKTEVASNDLAGLLKGGTIESVETITSFVNIPTVTSKNKAGGVIRNGTKEVVLARNEFDRIEELIPDPVNSLRTPFLSRPPTEEEIRSAISNIRNDAVGGQIPEEAAKSLRLHMTTPYEMDMAAVEEFLTQFDDPVKKAGILAALGYVEISEKNPAYAEMLYDDKMIQEGINEDILKGIEHIRDMYDFIRNSDEPNVNQVYFNYFYTTNHRFNIDSTTINPQGNKQLHRFFVTPKAQQVSYRFDSKNNTFVYTHTLKSGKKTDIDSSLYVRAGLAQAFGVGIDKTVTNGDSKGKNVILADGIIPIGNVLLSMSKESIDAAKAEFYKHGKFVLEAADGSVMEFKPDHYGHAIQAFKFLEEYRDAVNSGTGTITTNLTVETDALTSGFGNKVQQFGVVGDPNSNSVVSHAERIAFIKSDSNQIANFDDRTFGVNDMLASGELDDSYQNIAKVVIRDVRTLRKELKGNNAKLFNTVVSLLPGGDQLTDSSAQVVVDKALRTLFKSPFMVFNYAASVRTIVKNLGTEMGMDMMRNIAKADLNEKSKTFNKEAHTAATLLASLIVDPEDKNKFVGNPQKLQQMLRTMSVDKLRLKTDKRNASGEKTGTKNVNIIEYIAENVVEPTYGKAVEGAFDSEFKTFIEIQDATNDAFKEAFAVFHHALHKRMKKFRTDEFDKDGNLVRKGATIVTEADLLRFIEELRPVFPVIAGPLSDSLAEGIFIHETDTNTPDTVMSTVRTSQDKFNPVAGKRKASRKVNALLKNIVAAVNSGSVLPLHALDGAQLTTSVNTFAEFFIDSPFLDKDGNEIKDADGNTITLGTGLLPVHDAATVPLPFMDIFARIYNQNTINLNQTYSIFDEIRKLHERIAEVMDKGIEIEVTAPDGTKVTERVHVSASEMKAIEGLSIGKDDFVKSRKEALKTQKELIKARKVVMIKKRKEKADLAKDLEPTDDAYITANEAYKKALADVKEAENKAENIEAEISFGPLFELNKIRIARLAELVEKAREGLYEDGNVLGVMGALAGGAARVQNDSNGVTPRAVADEVLLDQTTSYLEDFHKRGAYAEIETTVRTTEDKPADTDSTSQKTKKAETLQEKLDEATPRNQYLDSRLPSNVSDTYRSAIAGTHVDLFVDGSPEQKAYNKVSSNNHIVNKRNDQNIVYPAIQRFRNTDGTLTDTLSAEELNVLGMDISSFVDTLRTLLENGTTVLFDSALINSEVTDLEKIVYNNLISLLGANAVIGEVSRTVDGNTVTITTISRGESSGKPEKKNSKGSFSKASKALSDAGKSKTDYSSLAELFKSLCS
jgi:hypothetical protein